MKRILKFGMSLALLTPTLLNTGCATILSGKNADIVLYDVPKDLEIKDNSVPVEIVKVFSSAKSRKNYENTIRTTTIYSSPGIQLNKKVKHILELTSGGKSVIIQVKSKLSGGYLFADIFLTGPIGIIIDAATKNWKTLRPKHLDVPALFNGTKQRSAHRLQKDLRKSFKKK